MMARPAAPAPHFAAPAPHMAAPAPHFAAPAPRMAAPAPHFAAPPAHFAAPAPHAAPRFPAPAPHYSAPAHVAAPHYSAPQRNFTASRAAPHAAQARPSVAEHRNIGGSRQATIARTARELNRHGATPPAEVGRNAGVNPRAGVTDNRLRQNQTDKGQSAIAARPGEPARANLNRPNGGTLNRPNEGALNRPNEGARNQSLAEAARSRVEQARRAPILKNPAFASTSLRAARTNPSNWTFRGNYAQSAFFRDHDRHHRHGGLVLGFAGLVFWPYAYDDFVDYTFAPYAYDTFWPYAFDDVYAGIYGGYAPEYYAPEDAYAYAGSAGSEQAYSRASRDTRGNASLGGSAARVCSGEAQGLTDFSIQKIAEQVQPTQDQQALLDDLKDATVRAIQILQAACPTELPSTATGRLAAMRARVDAMLQAVQTVGPALDKFYHSLDDEQRARFNAMDQGDQQAAQANSADLDRACNGQGGDQGRLPIDRIERTLQLNPAQEDGLRALDDATTRAAEILKSQCKPAETLTPTGRLAAMADRLTAMSKALEMTQAALTRFYGSLSDEQKAQFDRISARQA